MVCVTHDRYFLDNIAGWILEMDRGECIPFEGNYSAWLEQKQKRLAQEAKSESDKQKYLERELDWVRQGAKGRQSKSKARIQQYEELANTAAREKYEPGTIAIPTAERLGNLVLEVDGVRKAFGEDLLIEDLSFRVPPGAIVGIIGPNGAGKTTLLNVLSTLDRPDSGSVVVDGIEVAGLRDKALARFRNAHIGFVFQFHQLLPEFNALENAMLPALVGGRSESEAEAAAMARLEELGLAARAKHLPSQLSGGEQQRAAVARALVNDPPLLFADEPSGNLDSANADALHDLFFDLRERHGLTIALVTHNEGLADRADRQIRLRDGLVEV